MRISPDGFLRLTYCTNIHAADGWAAVAAALRRHAPALKARLSPDAPFGIGLRLSARDARELLDGHLDAFRDFLAREDLYVAIINGFPHGSFHRSVVKADVYAPDWRDAARVDYTRDLIEILAALLPEGLEGGVSTVPLSYKPWMRGDHADDWKALTANVARIAKTLVRLREQRGVFIHLDIEPEPDCVIENTEETIGFFEHWLMPYGATLLASALGCGADQARRQLADHIQVCFDCCHFSVEHEDPVAALQRMHQAGIRIGRVQLSSALVASVPADRERRAQVTNRLRTFADATYLHQVIRRSPAGLEHFSDLDVALAQCEPGEWRVHFHVPLFTSDYAGLRSTQHEVRDVLAAVGGARITRHLEIETYTWDVLPADLKLDLVESIAREYQWVLAAFPDRPRTGVK